MFRQMSVALVLAGSALVLLGCGRGNQPATDIPPGKTGGSADKQSITLHVRDMTDRQGLT